MIQLLQIFTNELCASLLAFGPRQRSALPALAAELEKTKDGPNAEDLEMELGWLLDDAIDSVRGPAGSTMHSRKMQQVLRADSVTAQDMTVSMRIDLEGLDCLWQQRTRERVPLQYLTGSAHWRDLVLAVGPGVLIPRPETELLIDFALEALRSQNKLPDGPWADLGSGSGALAIALARALPDNAWVYAVEKSADAEKWLRHNVDRYALQEKVQVARGSWFEPLEHLRSSLAGVLCNPPYIPSADIPLLQEEVSRHEPVSALDGGPSTGVRDLLTVCSQAGDMLAQGGFLGLETLGGAQAELVAEYLQDSMHFADVKLRNDLRGVNRFVTARR
ncbi:g5202 [Coccomyxa viridis]|uniref:G5202 protein n=1 Tax=Coccomyxa viridis TaxID=1274662 RepID=A0ABP1FS83_9CHLO